MDNMEVDILEKLNILVEHIYHSGFTIETKDKYLVFDYYKGNIDLSPKKTYVFVSHGHGDHFNPKILDWKKKKNNIKYIFSDDVPINNKDEDIIFLKAYEDIVLDNIKITSFGSTDIGLSFLVEIDDINIFFAGDLNWWHWKNDSKKEKLSMEKAFKEEIQRLKGKDVHIGFLPVDPRLEGFFHLAGDYFIKEIKPKYFFPMHFGDKYNTSTKFIHKIGNSSTNIVEINRENQIFQL